MTDQPKGKRGPKPKGRPPRRTIPFSVSEEDYQWLRTMENRSAWLAEVIEKERAKPDLPKTS